ncbi:MAG: Asp-tRNA(Asn)/Glu-tRNA(Gln) amidotransferase subunit GatB [Puniceicoccales bacterium]|jgi:aspartyl-tRNA(Asn)/glutamyl-tRNA(Gln) amidotransferase subunit B|nr:Asp-tRNA(Asn)/Glu-tRNA(Gln) amidotransferase subunit GatB [Puniceicoccales bacterium]
MEYDAIIGLEVHVQLKTKSKAFSRSRCVFGDEHNTATDPLTLGLPGALPVLNFGAIRQTVRAGAIFGCTIAKSCRWDRKNYFYPDNPKNYQITQQHEPLCIGGAVEIELPGEARNIQGIHRKVRLNRIHLEEDCGKLSHLGTLSLVDFNRAGVPLAEIVSEPDMHSAEEASAYLNSIRMHLSGAEVSDCDMEKGQMRCDVNVSLKPAGSAVLGERVEYKNLNSISGVRNAIVHEIARQRNILQSGGTIGRETRRWDAQRNTSDGLRAKENVHDYCYFPEPDIPPLKLDDETIESLCEGLPERPFDRQRRFMEHYELPYTVASVLCPQRQLADFFEAAAGTCKNYRAIANFIANDILRETSKTGEEIGLRIGADELAQLVNAIDEGRIGKQAAQNAIASTYSTGTSFREFLNSTTKEIAQETGATMEEICRRAIGASPKAVAEFRGGKETAINAIKGAAMRESKGKADPSVLDRILRELLR